MITSEGYGIKYKKPEYKDDYIKVFKVTQFSGHWSRCQRFDEDIKNSFLMTATTEIRVAFLIGCYLRAKIWNCEWTTSNQRTLHWSTQSNVIRLKFSSWCADGSQAGKNRESKLRCTHGDKHEVIRSDLKLCFLFLQVTACENVFVLHSTAQDKASNSLLFIDSSRSSNVLVGASRSQQNKTGCTIGNTK